MKYLILLYNNPHSSEWWHSLTPAQQHEAASSHQALTDRLADTGELIVSEALGPIELTKRVGVQDGRMLVTDGPLAETKEQLAGFFLVDVETAEQAFEHASTLPEAEYGLIEVRPILDISGAVSGSEL
jgi:hypothetical protein